MPIRLAKLAETSTDEFAPTRDPAQDVARRKDRRGTLASCRRNSGGKAAGRRSDIFRWAPLYEMVPAAAFGASRVRLRWRRPRDQLAVPPEIPPGLRGVIARCS